MSELSGNVESYQGMFHDMNAAAFYDALVSIEKLASEIADMLHPTCSRIDPQKIRALALVIVAACEHALEDIDEH